MLGNRRCRTRSLHFGTIFLIWLHAPRSAQLVKSSYKHKLSSLLSKLKAKVSYVALAGPILKGEYKENDIDPKLDDYEKMNKENVRRKW